MHSRRQQVAVQFCPAVLSPVLSCKGRNCIGVSDLRSWTSIPGWLATEKGWRTRRRERSHPLLEVVVNASGISAKIPQTLAAAHGRDLSFKLTEPYTIVKPLSNVLSFVTMLGKSSESGSTSWRLNVPTRRYSSCVLRCRKQ